MSRRQVIKDIFLGISGNFDSTADNSPLLLSRLLVMFPVPDDGVWDSSSIKLTGFKQG